METKQEEQAVERKLINNYGCKISATLTDRDYKEFIRLGWKDTSDTTESVRWGV